MHYLFNKLLHSFLIIIGVISIVFVFFNVIPADPAKIMLGQRDDIRQIEIINKKYAFDQPLTLQYFYYLNDLSFLSVHSNGDPYNYTYLNKYQHFPLITLKEKTLVLKFPYLRKSFVRSEKNVSDIIIETFPNTCILALSSIFFAIMFGVLFGVLSGYYKYSFIDRFILFVSSLGVSLPSFFSAIIFSWFFGFVLFEYTNLNLTGGLYYIDDFGNEDKFVFKNLILPAFTLGIRPLSVITQLTRNSYIEVAQQDYIRTAYAKGLSKMTIIKKHIMKNALNPIVTSVSGWFASMLAGAVFVEYIFSWNGIGKEIVESLNQMDLPVVMGCVILISLIFITINLIVDVVYLFLDPRVK